MKHFYSTEEANRMAAAMARQVRGTLHNVVVATGFSAGSFKYVTYNGKVVWAMSGSQCPGRRQKLWAVDIPYAVNLGRMVADDSENELGLPL